MSEEDLEKTVTRALREKCGEIAKAQIKHFTDKVQSIIGDSKYEKAIKKETEEIKKAIKKETEEIKKAIKKETEEIKTNASLLTDIKLHHNVEDIEYFKHFSEELHN